MKVILLQDVARVGQRGSVVQVKPGFAQNFLFPRRLAEVATKAREAATIKLQEKRAEEHAAQLEALKKAISGLKSPITISAKANEQGHLFEGVSAERVAEALTASIAIEVPASVITLEQPIKEVGDHTVSVTTGEWKGNVSVSVTAE